MTAAEELRAAAQRLRELAGAATEGPWKIWRDVDHQGFITIGDEAGVLTPERPVTDECNPVAHVYTDGDADWITAMHPGVALALAAWLESVAARHEASVLAAKQIWCIAEHPDAVAWLTTGPGAPRPEALAVARAIGGERP